MSKSKAAEWGEAHRREAWARVLEVAADEARRGTFVSMIPIIDGWDRFRYALRCAGLDPARIDREVARVHLLATGVLVRREHDTMTPIDRHSEERGHYKARVRKTTIRRVK